MSWNTIWLIILCSVLVMPAMADSPRNVALLASSCAACHGTHGHSVGIMPALVGLSERYFIDKMNAFRASTRPATVMIRHARGYTDEEIKLLAKFFAAQNK